MKMSGTILNTVLLFIISFAKDNGIGIPQKVVDKIFQPLFTTKPTMLRSSLSYDIIKAYGGEIKFESKQGEKCEFYNYNTNLKCASLH